jgi:hypothetical protein
MTAIEDGDGGSASGKVEMMRGVRRRKAFFLKWNFLICRKSRQFLPFPAHFSSA